MTPIHGRVIHSGGGRVTIAVDADTDAYPHDDVRVVIHPEQTDDIPTLTRSECREQALAFRNTLTEANLDVDTLHLNDIPAIQLALTASILYATMALDQDRPA